MKTNTLLIALLLSNIYTFAGEKKINGKILEDITFWTNQYVEHAEFATGFADNSALKEEGKKLENQAKEFKSLIHSNENLQSDFKKLSKDMKSYQEKVSASLKKNKKNKDVKLELDILDHMNLETDYAVKKSEGKKLSREEEAKFWSQEHEGEAKVISALMNPTGETLKKESDGIVQSLEKNVGLLKKSDLKVVEEANEELDSIGKALDKDPKKTRVPKKLAKHEERERKYAAEIFKKLDQEAK